MPFGTRVWGFGKTLVLIGALGATFLISFGVSMRIALRSREVEVPKLEGLTVSEATETLGGLGLGLRVDEVHRPDNKVAAGHVMQQEPAPRTTARRQRTIRVWVSAGPHVTTVPQLIGQSERTARIRLDQDGVQIGPVSEFRSADYPADAVVAQNPAPMSQAPQVSLLLNRGEQAQSFVMPDVIGMDGPKAAEILRARGFRVSIVGTQQTPGVPAGTIIRQQPAGGFQVGPNDTVSLEVTP
ncbi:MAG TPA: PASTA domain-containing protein [Vicinamibacterales bacterium]|jgi:serine/threonine-protein kinase